MQFSLRAEPVYRRIDVNVYQNSTEHAPTTMQLAGFRAVFGFSADYHQQYLAKNPGGYCPDHSCGIPYKSPVIAEGQKAQPLV
jgi:peptide methionine sulfoxide reductase MsrA